MRLCVGLELIAGLRYASERAIPHALERLTTERESCANVAVHHQASEAITAARRGIGGGISCRAGFSRRARSIQCRRCRCGQLHALTIDGQAAGIDRHRHIERVGLITIVGGEEDARSGHIHAELLGGSLDLGNGLVGGVIQTIQTILAQHRGRHQQHRGLLGLHDVRDQRAVIDVRHRGQHILQVVQAELDECIRVAMNVQIRKTIDQVPAVIHVIRPQDIGQLPTAALTLQIKREMLVHAAPVVVQIPHDAGFLGVAVDLVEVRRGAGNGQPAITDLGIAAIPAQLRARTIRLAGKLELHVRIIGAQHRIIRQSAHVVEHVIDLAQVLANHQRAIHMATAGHDYSCHDTDHYHDDQGNKKFKDTHHFQSSPSVSTPYLKGSPRPPHGPSRRSHPVGHGRGSANAEATDVTCSRAGTLLGFARSGGWPQSELQQATRDTRTPLDFVATHQFTR